jgi:hypothetical protein
MLGADGQTKVVWIADFLPDFLPDLAAAAIGAMMDDGMRAMQQTLDRLADRS